MGLEIEHKFLVRTSAWKSEVAWSETLRQGYLANTDHVSVRVRTVDGSAAWLSIKHGGTARIRREFEYPIPLADATEMLRLCGHSPIRKRRHHLDLPGGDWVVDEFEGRHVGLVLAEIELARADQDFPRPDWLGKEVTNDPRYYNAVLATGADGEI
jgi:CYTH domain-containing protein